MRLLSALGAEREQTELDQTRCGDAMQDQTPDLYRDILGIDLPAERLTEILRLYADILGAVTRLRALDLTEVHPAVLFDPASGWDEEGTP
jgi:hypothetical protein